MDSIPEDISILVVDDQPDILFGTTRLLKREGYQVTGASSGTECRSHLKTNHPDLILLDVVLPDLDGRDLCREIKKSPVPHRPYIILISGQKTSSDQQAEALESGADAYITRPVGNRELKARVKAIARMIMAEKALKDSEEKFRQLIENISEVFWIRDVETQKLIYVSPNVETIWGIPADTVFKKPDLFLDAIHPEDREKIVGIFGRQSGNEPFEMEYRIVRPDGTIRWVHGKNFPILDDDGRVCRRGGINIDITEKKRMADELIQVQRMEAIGTLAGGIAHDFNNILSSILGFSELAVDDAPSGSMVEDSLNEVIAAGKRARDLVRQILTFARQIDEPFKPVMIRLIASEVVKFIRSSIPSTIEVRQDIQSDALVMGNPGQIHQIVMNLCTNAAQAMEASGGVLDVSLKEVDIEPGATMIPEGIHPGRYVDIQVSDTGTGIPSHVIGSIFEPYFTTKPQGEGTGMGLAVVKGIVEKHEGGITVTSRPGKGTVFRVLLPVVKRTATPQPDASGPLPRGTERILLVDDEAAIAKMGQKNLESLGYRVTTRTSSIEALALFQAKPDAFDLVISDMTMPNMTGDVLAEKLMMIRPDIPVIICTGYSRKMSEEIARRIGVKDFVYKPVVKKDLAATVRKVLDDTAPKSA